MKKKLTTLTLAVGLTSMSAGAYAQRYTGSSTWTTAPVESQNVCVHSASRVSCAINLTYKLANSIFPNVSYEQYGTTFLPILQAAAFASDSLTDLGPWALETRAAVVNLVSLLDKKEKEIDSLLTIPAQFDLARKLKSTIRIIKRDLN